MSSCGWGAHVELLGHREDLTQDAAEGDLRQRAIENGLADGAAGLGEGALVLDPRHETGIEEDIRDTGIVAAQEPHEHACEMTAAVEVEPAHDAEIQGHDVAARVDQHVARMHVTVKEAVAKHLVEEDGRRLLEDLVRVVAGLHQPFGLVDRQAVHSLEGGHAPGGTLPVDLRDSKARIVGAVLGQLRRSGGFEPEVHFPPRRGGEDGHGLDGSVAAKVRLGPLDQTGRPFEQVEILLDGLLDTRAQDLHRHGLAQGGFRQMHLGDGGGGDGLVLELAEQLGHGLLEFALYGLSGLAGGKRRQLVLQPRQITSDALAQEIGPGGEALPELDEAGAEFLECAGEPLTRPTFCCTIAQRSHQPQEGGRLRHQLERKQRVVSRQRSGDGQQPPSVTYAAKHRPLSIGTRAQRRQPE